MLVAAALCAYSVWLASIGRPPDPVFVPSNEDEPYITYDC